MDTHKEESLRNAGHRSSGQPVDTEVHGNRHVLMITYVFPPAAWVGAHRTLKYCRYLGGHGWTPVVLTARTDGVTFTDETLLRQLPSNVDVYRTMDVDPAKWEDKLTERKLRRNRREGAMPATPPASTPSNAPGASYISVFAKRLRDWLKIVLKNSPDSHLFWVPFALFRGARILLTRRIDVIYCSTPPHSSHIAAFLLARAFRKPYVLDFRDPWYVTGSARTPEGKLKTLLKAETLIKRAIVRQAAHVICVSRGECDEMRTEFPGVEATRFSCITNGYDPADIVRDGVVARPSSSKLVMIHAGTINAGVVGEFFTALEQLHTSDNRMSEKLEVWLVGEIAAEYQNALQRLEGHGILKAFGLVPHAQTLRMIRESDVLLILMGGSLYRPSHIPSKTFEYLQAEKPILAIAGDGELADIAKQSGLGLVVSPESADDIATHIRELLVAREAGAISRSPVRTFIRSFERPALTQQLAGILDSVIEPCDVNAKRA